MFNLLSNAPKNLYYQRILKLYPFEFGNGTNQGFVVTKNNKLAIFF